MAWEWGKKRQSDLVKDGYHDGGLLICGHRWMSQRGGKRTHSPIPVSRRKARNEFPKGRIRISSEDRPKSILQIAPAAAFASNFEGKCLSEQEKRRANVASQVFELKQALRLRSRDWKKRTRNFLAWWRDDGGEGERERGNRKEKGPVSIDAKSTETSMTKARIDWIERGRKDTKQRSIEMWIEGKLDWMPNLNE